MYPQLKPEAYYYASSRWSARGRREGREARTRGDGVNSGAKFVFILTDRKRVSEKVKKWKNLNRCSHHGFLVKGNVQSLGSLHQPETSVSWRMSVLPRTPKRAQYRKI